MSVTFSLAQQPALSRRSFAVGAAATAAMAAAGLAAPAFADQVATDAVSGASTAIDESKQLTQEQIHDLACEYLHGWPLKTAEDGTVIYSYREMYAIATCMDNHPGLSQVEFVLDPATMKLVCASEKGTEKCVHLASNPEAVLYWYHQIPEADYIPYQYDYFNSYGVQFKGTARFVSLEDEDAYDIASRYIETLYGAEAWGAQPEDQQRATIEKLFEWNDWIEIEPSEVVVNSLFWVYNKEESRRPEWYDPESPYFGKSVRQVYYPTAE